MIIMGPKNGTTANKFQADFVYMVLEQGYISSMDYKLTELCLTDKSAFVGSVIRLKWMDWDTMD